MRYCISGKNGYRALYNTQEAMVIAEVEDILMCFPLAGGV
jgi:hypothetical protein